MEVILDEHYELLFAENGKEGLELMKQNAAELSIVLLDRMSSTRR